MSEQSTALFQLRYSYNLETMTMIFHSRIDKLLTAIQLISGTAVIANTGLGWFFALPVVVIATTQLIWQPSIIAERASVQCRQYADLLYNSDTLPAEDIFKALKTLHHTDSTPFGSLLNPAYKRAAISSGLPDDTTLTTYEKVMAWIAGDLPR
ncbi:hypothetical protein ABRQ00_13000 [Pectobacterium aroidearum]|uniref:hypothetical protein n=1 Tax=Pectobacterium aroidearum TaxID=1201031 RepID=UPI002FCC58F3